MLHRVSIPVLLRDFLAQHEPFTPVSTRSRDGLSHEEYMAGLSQRGVPLDFYSGSDHEGLNDSLEIAARGDEMAAQPGD